MWNRRFIAKTALVIAMAFLLLWSISTVIMLTCKNYSPLNEAQARTLSSQLLATVKSGNSSSRTFLDRRCFFQPWKASASDTSLRDGSKRLYPNGMPMIVHTTWKTDLLTESWKYAEWKCRQLNRDFAFCHWTDDDLFLFVASEYPDMLDRFIGYPYPIQRADAGRYLLLHKLGGFYRDVNIVCKVSFDELYRNESLRQPRPANSPFKVLLVKGNPMALAGDFMASTPGHPFFRRLVDGLRSRPSRYGLPFLDVMMGTGPLYLGSVYHAFLRDRSIEAREKEEVRLMPDDQSIKKYFGFLKGGTWHCLDGLILWYTFEHLRQMAFAACGLVLFVISFAFIILPRVQNFRKMNRWKCCQA